MISGKIKLFVGEPDTWIVRYISCGSSGQVSDVFLLNLSNRYRIKENQYSEFPECINRFGCKYDYLATIEVPIHLNDYRGIITDELFSVIDDFIVANHPELLI